MTIELREEARRREAERERTERKKEEFARDLRHTALQPEGKRILRWLLEQGDIYRIDYLPGQLGAYHAGQRAFALRLWHALRHHLDAAAFAALVLHVEENHSRSEHEEDPREVPVTAFFTDYITPDS